MTLLGFIVYSLSIKDFAAEMSVVFDIFLSIFGISFLMEGGDKPIPEVPVKVTPGFVGSSKS